MHVDVKRWIRDLILDSRNDGKDAVLNALRGLHNGVFYTITTRYPIGTNIFERDWDLLIVLDACRVDAIREVASEFEFIDTVNSIWSVGSSSHEWLCKTFTQEYSDEIRETIYLSANPNTPSTFQDGVRPPRSYSIPLMWADWNVIDETEFRELIMLTNYDHDYPATIAPEVVTDYAIHTGRTHEFERLVVHYFQPHRPYISEAYSEGRPVNDMEDQPWIALRSGTATKEEIWQLYLDNLRFVLTSISRLLKNFDADSVVITADHGDLFGEFGEYGHPEGFIHPHLKRVPWIECTATDEKTSDPIVNIEHQESDIDTDSQLRHLGYL